MYVKCQGPLTSFAFLKCNVSTSVSLGTSGYETITTKKKNHEKEREREKNLRAHADDSHKMSREHYGRGRANKTHY